LGVINIFEGKWICFGGEVAEKGGIVEPLLSSPKGREKEEIEARMDGWRRWE
jgi:hypothetical protein